MKICDLQAESRPRERFARLGPSALTDSELLAIILRTGTKNNNIIDVCNKLLSKYNLDKLLNNNIDTMKQINFCD